MGRLEYLEWKNPWGTILGMGQGYGPAIVGESPASYDGYPCHFDIQYPASKSDPMIVKS